MTVVLSSKSKKRNKKLDESADRIATSLKRFKITNEAESEWRKQGLQDLKFSIGTGQWDESVKANREIEGKPCLTVNRAHSFLRQYTGEERQHRPAMIVSPQGNGATHEVAKIHQGVLRHIEVVSFADTVYDDAYEMMLRIGSCPWRILPEYISERSFFQEPRIIPVENPFSSYISPIRKPDGTDPLWWHVTEDLSKEEYEERYPNSEMVKLHFPTLQGNAEPDWVTKAGVRNAEYWYLELSMERLCLLPDGSAHLKKDLAKDLLSHVEAERDTLIRKVKWVKHNAIEILEEKDYVGQHIPVVEVNGVRLNVNGQIYKCGMIRDYRDAQRIYDFMVTRAVEHVDMTSKDPLLVPRGAVENFEEAYRVANRKNYPYLLYEAYDKDGKPLPPPGRANRQSSIDAIQKLIQQADYDMKAVIGIYGPGLGEQGPEQESGFAILTRQQQSDTGMVTFHDNLNRAIRWQAKLLVDLWPKLINWARVQRIVNPDDSIKHEVVYNSTFHDPSLAEQMSPEEQKQGATDLLLDHDTMKEVYDVGVGDYDVTLSTGPMYRTARQEAFRALTVVISQKPELLPILGDVWAKNADFPDADVIEARLKKMLPPNLQEQSDADKDSQIAALTSQVQGLGEQHQQLVAELNRASDTIRTKRLDIESRERVALMNNWTQIMLQRLQSHDAAAQAQMDAELGAITMRLQLLNAGQPVEAEAGEAPAVPELPSKVEPKVQPITPAQPRPPVPGTSGTGGVQ
jgi:hypothetical protein